MELLKDVSPKISVVAVLWIPTGRGNNLQMKETKAAAHSFGIRLQPAGVEEPKDFESAFSAIARGAATSLTVFASPMFVSHRARIADLATKSMSYGNNLNMAYRRAAVYVDKILKGAKPADLPVERPMNIEFAINLKTAKQIGLTIPPAVLYRANKVIKRNAEPKNNWVSTFRETQNLQGRNGSTKSIRRLPLPCRQRFDESNALVATGKSFHRSIPADSRCL